MSLLLRAEKGLVGLRRTALGVAVLLAGLAPLASAAQSVSLTDDSGARVTLAAPAQRIIALSPHIVENLFAVGAGGQIVGTVDFSNYPQEALSIARVGSYDRFDVERILALAPDLVIGWASGSNRAQLTQLKALGLTVYLSEPDTIDGIGDELARFGHLSGRVAEGNAAAGAFRARLDGLRKTYSQRPRVSVFYQIWDTPLMTVGGRQIISQAIGLCSGDNVFAKLTPLAPQISIEAVLAANAEVFVAGGMNEERRDWLASWRRWPQLLAVQRDNLFFVPADWMQRHTPRLLAGIETLCAHLEVARARH